MHPQSLLVRKIDTVNDTTIMNWDEIRKKPSTFEVRFIAIYTYIFIITM